jgi:hypothetical protein
MVALAPRPDAASADEVIHFEWRFQRLQQILCGSSSNTPPGRNIPGEHRRRRRRDASLKLLPLCTAEPLGPRRPRLIADSTRRGNKLVDESAFITLQSFLANTLSLRRALIKHSHACICSITTKHARVARTQPMAATRQLCTTQDFGRSVSRAASVMRPASGFTPGGNKDPLQGQQRRSVWR